MSENSSLKVKRSQAGFMTNTELADLLGISRNTTHRWATHGPTGLAYFVVRSLETGKVKDVDIMQWRKELGDPWLDTRGSPPPSVVRATLPGADRKVYVDRYGIKRFDDTNELAPTSNPLAGWHK